MILRFYVDVSMNFSLRFRDEIDDGGPTTLGVESLRFRLPAMRGFYLYVASYNAHYLLLFSNSCRGLMTTRRIVEFEVEFPFTTNEKLTLSFDMRLSVALFSCIGKMG